MARSGAGGAGSEAAGSGQRNSAPSGNDTSISPTCTEASSGWYIGTRSVGGLVLRRPQWNAPRTQPIRGST